MSFMSIFYWRKPRASTSSDFAEFIRNASSGEKKRVYTKAIKDAIERQRAVLESRPTK